MTLPCGESVRTNRGAGQGEPEGPLKAALTIGDADATTKEDMVSAGVRGMIDKWFIDDGQLFWVDLTNKIAIFFTRSTDYGERPLQ